MSDASSPDHSGQPVWPWALAAIGGFAIFLVILLVAYVPQKPGAVEGTKTPEQRKALRAEIEGKQKTAYSSYGWVDEKGGVVRVPVERAMDLYVAEHKK